MKYKTEKFDMTDDDILWEKFMCFVRMIIPYEKYWDELTECQKYPIISFIYESEVLGEGHMGFIDLHSKYISFDDVIKSLRMLHVSPAYIENIEKIPKNTISVNELIDESDDEEEFLMKMDEMDAVFEQHDKFFYELEIQEWEIEDKILKFLRQNGEEFFETVT